ncbi:hypothetical protein CsSME_00042081 [Camellia sinensis var. sinensis]
MEEKIDRGQKVMMGRRKQIRFEGVKLMSLLMRCCLMITMSRMEMIRVTHCITEH